MAKKELSTVAELIRKKHRFPKVIISDTHFFKARNNAELLYEFLGAIDYDVLIKNGDSDDGWYALDHKFRPLPEMQMRAKDRLHANRMAGKGEIEIPGNHDCKLRDMPELYGKPVQYDPNDPGIIYKQDDLIDLDDYKNVRIRHGDQYDKQFLKWQREKHKTTRMDNFINGAIDTHHTMVEKTEYLTGIHFSVVDTFKRLANQGSNAISPGSGFMTKFENTAIQSMKHTNIIGGELIGHIHHMNKREFKAHDGRKMLYANSGDWSEKASALAVDQDGKLHLINWLVVRKELGYRRIPRPWDENEVKAFRPMTEKQVSFVRDNWPSWNQKNIDTKARVLEGDILECEIVLSEMFNTKAASASPEMQHRLKTAEKLIKNIENKRKQLRNLKDFPGM